MDFHYFQMFWGNSGKLSEHPPKLCAGLQDHTIGGQTWLAHKSRMSHCGRLYRLYEAHSDRCPQWQGVPSVPCCISTMLRVYIKKEDTKAYTCVKRPKSAGSTIPHCELPPASQPPLQRRLPFASNSLSFSSFSFLSSVAYKDGGCSVDATDGSSL